MRTHSIEAFKMSEIIPNVVVSMPSQLFTMPREFKSVFNGMIYIGKIDTDPTIQANQIQVYLENEDGSYTPMPQPIRTNAGGYPVYNGKVSKFVTVEGHSMLIQDANGVQLFYFPNVLKYDPDQFASRAQLKIDAAIDIPSLSFVLGDFILVGGYYYKGDGANHFRVVENSDDGSGIQLSNGLWANIVYENFVHVGWFGAKQDGVTDDSDAITRAHNFYRYHVKMNPVETYIAKPIPFGMGSYYSGIVGAGEQFPSGNVVRWLVSPGMTCVFNTTLTSDNILRNARLSAMRLTLSTYNPDFSFINCDIPFSAIEVDHLHIENFKAFISGSVSNRFPEYIGAFVVMGSRLKFTDCTFMVDYTIKFSKGVAGTSWSNQNYMYNCQLGCIDIDATMQNWNLTDCLYEARAYSNGTVGILTLPLFIARNRIEGLEINNLYCEGIYSGFTTPSSQDWSSAQSTGTKVKDVTVYTSPSTSTTYSVYSYNSLLYVGVAGGNALGAIDPTKAVPVVQANAAAKVRFNGGIFAAFQTMFENKSNFYTSDVEIVSPEIFDGNENGVGNSSASLSSALSLPLIKVAVTNLANVRWFGNKNSYRDVSSLPINLYSTDNIQMIGNYNQTRISGNTTLQSKIKINSSTIYLTTSSNSVHGSGYSELDPLYVPQSLAAIFGTLAPHDNIVFVNSIINHISIAGLPFKCRITLKNTTINVPMQSFGNPYINAPHGVKFIGSTATINFTGTIPVGSSFDYWINQPEAEYVFRGLSINGVAGSAVSLINNNVDYSPNSVKIYSVIGNGDGSTARVYISKSPITSTTLYTMNNSSGLTVRT